MYTLTSVVGHVPVLCSWLACLLPKYQTEYGFYYNEFPVRNNIHESSKSIFGKWKELQIYSCILYLSVKTSFSHQWYEKRTFCVIKAIIYFVEGNNYDGDQEENVITIIIITESMCYFKLWNYILIFILIIAIIAITMMIVMVQKIIMIIISHTIIYTCR